MLDLVSMTMRHWAEAEVPPTAGVRMRDYARVGEALGVGLGWEPGSFTALYSDNLRRAASEIASDDPIYEPLVVVLREAGGSWTGKMGELLKALNSALDVVGLASAAEIRRSKEWPKGARGLGSKLARLAPALEARGIFIGEPREVHGSPVRTLTLDPTSPSEVPPTEPTGDAK